MSLRYRRMIGGKKPWWLAGGISPDVAMAVFQPRGAESYAKSLMNLTGVAAYDAYAGVAPDWDDVSGWKFNGTDDRLLSDGISIGDNFWTIIIRFSNLTNNGAVFGCTKTGSNLVFYPKYSDNLHYAYYSEERTGAGFTSGVAALNVNDLFINGVGQGHTFTGWSAAARLLTIGAEITNYYAAFYCQAFAAYHATLTDAQVLAVTNAMNAL